MSLDVKNVKKLLISSICVYLRTACRRVKHRLQTGLTIVRSNLHCMLRMKGPVSHVPTVNIFSCMVTILFCVSFSLCGLKKITLSCHWVFSATMHVGFVCDSWCYVTDSLVDYTSTVNFVILNITGNP